MSIIKGFLWSVKKKVFYLDFVSEGYFQIRLKMYLHFCEIDFGGASTYLHSIFVVLSQIIF